MYRSAVVHGFFMLDKEYTVRYTVGRSHIYMTEKDIPFRTKCPCMSSI